MGRTARGVRAIKLRENDYVVGATKVYGENMTLLTVTDKGMGRRVSIDSYKLQNRGGLGLMNYKVSDEKGYVCGIRAIGTDDDVILISDEGIIIRIRANDIRVMGRYATGVRVMRLQPENKVVAFTRTEHDDTADIEEIEQASEEEIALAQAEEASEVIVNDAAEDEEPDNDNDFNDGDKTEDEEK